MQDIRRRDGFSATEVTIALAVTTLLTTTAAPSIESYVSLAQDVRAQHDVRTLALSLVRLHMDISHQSRRPNGLARFTVLVGDGEAPAASTESSTPWTVGPSTPAVDRLEAHLLTNEPSYERRSVGMGGGWRGPYLDAPIVQSDPWGHRYAVNIGGLQDRAFTVIVLSAGPNGIVETPFAFRGGERTGDDIMAIVASAH